MWCPWGWCGGRVARSLFVRERPRGVRCLLGLPLKPAGRPDLAGEPGGLACHASSPLSAHLLPRLDCPDCPARPNALQQKLLAGYTAAPLMLPLAVKARGARYVLSQPPLKLGVPSDAILVNKPEGGQQNLSGKKCLP